MKLLFVRHGQTDWNRDMRLMGQMDIPLNEAGRAQCTSLAKHLQEDFEAIFSSPLKRALETAEFIAEPRGKEIILKEELLERDMGSLSGLTWEEIASQTKSDMKTVAFKEQYDFRPYGGESANDVQNRVQKFIAELQEGEFKTVAVVSHSGVISMMHYLYPTNTHYEIENVSVHEFILP